MVVVSNIFVFCDSLVRKKHILMNIFSLSSKRGETQKSVLLEIPPPEKKN